MEYSFKEGKIKLLGNIMKKKVKNFDLKGLINSFSRDRFVAALLFSGLVIFFAWFTYGKAIDYYFWRDDTSVVWMVKYIPGKIFSLSSDAIGRGKFGAILIDLLSFKILGFESHNWQVAGLVLKIINTFLLFFFTRELFRSTKLALVTSLLAASFIGGLEAYSWVRGIGIMITLSLLAFIFYTASYYSKKKMLFFLASIFSFLVVFIYPAKGFAIIPLIVAWESLMLISKKPSLPVKDSIARIIVFVSTQFLLLKTIFYFSGGQASATVGSIPLFIRSALNVKSIENFLLSLGNLLREPFLFTYELGGLSTGDAISLYLGIIFFIVFALLTIIFIKYRSNKIVPWLTIFLWIPFFYGPNWLYESTLVAAATHRYLALSAVLVPIFWAKAVTSLRRIGIAFILVLIILFLNISYAQKTVDHDYLIRGKDAVMPIINKWVSSVPPGETKSVMTVLGDHYLRGYVFDWSGPWTYAYLRGIGNYNDLPIFVNYKMGASLMCDPETQIIDWEKGGLMRAGEISTLDKVHGFYVNNYGLLDDRTEETKFEIAKKANCLAKKQFVKVLPELIIKTTTLVDNLDGKKDGRTGLIINWKKNSGQGNIYFFIIFLTNRSTSETLDVKPGMVQFNKGISDVQTTTVFNSLVPNSVDSKKPLEFEAKINICSGYCDFAKISNGIIRLDL